MIKTQPATLRSTQATAQQAPLRSPEQRLGAAQAELNKIQSRGFENLMPEDAVNSMTLKDNGVHVVRDTNYNVTVDSVKAAVVKLLKAQGLDLPVTIQDTTARRQVSFDPGNTGSMTGSQGRPASSAQQAPSGAGILAAMRTGKTMEQATADVIGASFKKHADQTGFQGASVRSQDGQSMVVVDYSSPNAWHQTDQPKWQALQAELGKLGTVKGPVMLPHAVPGAPASPSTSMFELTTKAGTVAVSFTQHNANGFE
jgi:hypothetical protein